MSPAVSPFPRTTSLPAPATVATVRAGRSRSRRRTRRVTALLVLVLVLASFARIALGKYVVAVPDLFAVLTHDYSGPAAYIVWDITLPRTVLGILTGIAFGIAGHLFQRVLRSPLASPDIMGVSSGAGLGAVAAITLGGLSGAAVTLSSLAGGFGLMVAVVLAAGGTRANIGKLVLTGVSPWCSWPWRPPPWGPWRSCRSWPHPLRGGWVAVRVTPGTPRSWARCSWWSQTTLPRRRSPGWPCPWAWSPRRPARPCCCGC